MKKIHPVALVGIFLLLVVSVFAWSQNREAGVLFVGDMFFDRYIRQISYIEGEGQPFSCIGNFLKDSDLVVGNLEGPITENASVSMLTKPGGDGNFTFTFPTNTAKLLFENNIRLVNLGNNHINNFGRAGIESTKKFLSEAGVKYFGGLAGDEEVVREDLGGQKISFVSFNEFGGDSAEKVSKIIKVEKQNGRRVIVYAHWGEEYVSPTTQVKKLAHLFIDAGAEMIVGSHPHIIQESEIYNGKQIYYSLGNFIFDQYWDESASTGLVLEAQISGREIKITEHRVSLNKDGRTCLMSSN